MNDKIRVLLVDDEESLVRGMARVLRFRGFDVETAISGYEAVEFVRRGGFDVVVLDIKMPGMDGIEALLEIKKLKPETEVIMLTGHASVASGVQALRRGAYDYLMKPCDAEELSERIKEAHEAESIKKNPVLWPRRRVREMMLYPVRRLLPDVPVRNAIEALRGEPGGETAEEVFVMDRDSALLGVVTRRRLLDVARENHPLESLEWNKLLDHPEWLPEIPVEQVMRQAPPSAGEPESLSDAAERMILHGVRTLPVLREGKVIGVIGLQDVFRHLEHEME